MRFVCLKMLAFQRFCQSALVLAQMLLALAALERLVAGFKKTFLPTVVSNFPAQTEDCRQNAGGSGKKASDQQQRRTEHEVVPIVNATSGAATVVHHPGLKGTEKQDAYDVTNAIKTRKTYQEAIVYPSFQSEQEEQTIQKHPGE